MNDFLKKVYPGIGQSWGIMGVAIVAMFLFMPINLMLNDTIGKEASFLIYYLLTMGSPLAFGYYMRKKESGVIGFQINAVNLKTIIIIALGTIAFQLGVITPLVSLIPIPELFKQMFIEMANLNGVFAFITMVIAAPVLEELVFRGIILNGLLKKYTPLKSIFISSLIFGLIHLNPWQFIAALFIGAFMGWVYYKTHNLILPIVIHFVNNLFAFVSARFTNPEEAFDMSLADMYGGQANMIFAIVGGTAFFVLCVFLLQKMLTTYCTEEVM